MPVDMSCAPVNGAAVSASDRSSFVALPIDDRVRSRACCQEAFGFEPVGEPAEDGVPEPLAFRIGQCAQLVLTPGEGG